MIRMFRKLGFAALGAVLLFAGGCSDAAQPVAAVETGPFLAAGSGGPDMSRLARFQKRPQITIAWAKKWIGPQGGRLDFQGFAIEVPAGAVTKPTLFGIRLPVDPHGSDRVVAEFSPHNAQFAVPVAIEFPYAGTSIEGVAEPTVVWWNSEWVDVGASITADGTRLRTVTDHFSTYGTTDRSGALAVSGG